MVEETDRHVLVLSSVGSKAEAESIACALVERRLAACVQVVEGICSVFRWKGRIAQEAEWLLMIKTEAHLVDEVEAAVGELHSYEVPEFAAIPLSVGSTAFLGWWSENVRRPDEPPADGPASTGGG